MAFVKSSFLFILFFLNMLGIRYHVIGIFSRQTFYHVQIKIIYLLSVYSLKLRKRCDHFTITLLNFFCEWHLKPKLEFELEQEVSNLFCFFQ